MQHNKRPTGASLHTGPSHSNAALRTAPSSVGPALALHFGEVTRHSCPDLASAACMNTLACQLSPAGSQCRRTFLRFHKTPCLPKFNLLADVSAALFRTMTEVTEIVRMRETTANPTCPGVFTRRPTFSLISSAPNARAAGGNSQRSILEPLECLQHHVQHHGAQFQARHVF